MDAIGYLLLGQIFTANMTGNTVLLGIDLARQDWGPALRHATPLPLTLLAALAVFELLAASRPLDPT